MADSKISALTSLSPVADDDLIVVVDISDTTMAVTGTTKKALKSELKGDKGDTGLTGATGQTGTTGSQGVQGVQGVQGEAGSTGTAATVTAGTTTTGVAGSDATVTNSGSTSAAVFDFTIPRGNTGATGTAGTNGTNGTNGAAGADGTNGTDGDDAYVYIAYASDASGTGFTNTFDAALNYIAVKKSTTPIASPIVTDFTGLWKNYKGATGETGATGAAGLGDMLLGTAQTVTAAKTFNTGTLISPNITGGTAVGSNIIYKSTTGIGTTTGIAHQLTGGTNGATVIATMLNNGNVGIGITSPLSTLHLKAGTATASTAPLKLTQASAVVLTTPEPGTIECNDGDALYYTIKTGSARKTIAFTTDITGTNSNTNTGDQVGDGTTITGAGTVADPFVAVGGGGGITRSVTTKSTDHTAGATALTDYYFGVTGTTTITLPTAASNTNLYVIKCISGTTTIATTSAQTIDGSATAVLSVANTSLSLISDGSNWLII